MGFCRVGPIPEVKPISTATMCIVGLQVHVHVKDGSVFSGVFYTASFENGFGTSIEFLNLILCVCCYNNARSLEI